jgi:uncharacterized membrane protein
MIKVLYVGDAAGVLGPSFIASPFNVENKGFSFHIWCQPVLDALNSDPKIEVVHLTNWDAYRDFPRTPEDFAKYNVVFLSDVESEVLLLYPEWTQAPMGPNRLKSLRKYTADGGSLCMIGGWSSFSGTWIEILKPDHPIIKGIPWNDCPCFLGYNRIIAKEGADIIARTKETHDPFIVTGTFGKGRTMAFASDISPHWAVAFQKWEHYGEFFRRTVRWLAKAV